MNTTKKQSGKVAVILVVAVVVIGVLGAVLVTALKEEPDYPVAPNSEEGFCDSWQASSLTNRLDVLVANPSFLSEESKLVFRISGAPDDIVSIGAQLEADVDEWARTGQMPPTARTNAAAYDDAAAGVCS